jgi:DNA-binding PadR family transcriptional regulator
MFAKFGLGTSYELTSQTGMSVGHTLPALKRLQESGLMRSVPGPRKRIEFLLTPEGEKALLESLTSARSKFWEIEKANTFESLPRAVFLLWVYFGKEEALRCVSWATAELRIQARRKQYEADETLHDVQRLHGTNLVGEDPSSRDGLLAGKSYRYLKLAAEASLLKMQADAAEQMPRLLDSLPTSLRRSI